MSFCLCAALLAAGVVSIAATDGAPYVVFLGTGAADIETPKQDTCPNCTYIREHGGKNWRRYSSLLVSPDVVIDYSTTGRDGLRAVGILPSTVNYLLITHSHADHFSPASIVELANEKGGSGITMFCDAETAAKMREYLASLKEKPPIAIRELDRYEEFDAGQWHCKAVPSNHDALMYVMRGKSKSLFYATDTTWFPAGTFNALRSEKLDLAIVEGTFGETEDPALLTGHMSFAFDRLVKRFLFQEKVMKPGGKFGLTHLSLHHCEPHDKLQPKLEREQIILPYDDMRLEF